MNRQIIRIASCLLGAMLLSPMAWSQDQTDGDAEPIEEILVTAQRREQNLADIPVAISALTGEHLDDIGAVNLVDFLNEVPNVQFSALNSGQTFITIRGVSGNNINSSTIGYYIDDVPITSFTSQPHLTAYDIERVEVLRGPQGTLYGEGAMGGAVRIITGQPDTSQNEGTAEATFRSIEHGGTGWDLNGMVNVAASDVFAIRATIAATDDDGWIDAPFRLGGAEEDVNDIERFTARVGALWTPTDRFSINLGYIYSESESGGWAESLPDYTTIAQYPDNMHDDVELFRATLAYEFDGMTLTSITGVYDRENLRDADGTAFLPIVNTILPIFGFDPVDTFATRLGSIEDSFTQELRLVSTTEGSFDWVVGAYYKDAEKQDVARTITIPPLPPGVVLFDSISYFDTEELSFYGEGTYHVNDRFHLTGGLRYFSEDRFDSSLAGGLFTFHPPGEPLPVFSDESDNDVLTWKASASYDTSDSSLIWATVATGFRSSGINPYAGLTGGLAPTTFESDELISYEVGYKMTSADGRVFFDVAAYYNDWDDFQYVVELIGGIFPIFGNDPEGAEIKGIEAQFVWKPVDVFELTASGALIDSELKSTGTDLVNVPGEQLTLTGTWRQAFSGGMSGMARAVVTYTGSQFNDAANLEEFPSSTKLDLRAGLEWDRWQIYGFIENATDEDIFYGIGPNHPIRARPRTYGVTLRAQF